MSQASLRRSDSNSLLRLFDQAQEAARSSASQHERARAEKALERLARELERRNVKL